MPVFKCPECGKKFEDENEKKAWKKLKEHQEEDHFKKEKKEDLSYIT
jgi:transposase-like protein